MHYITAVIKLPTIDDHKGDVIRTPCDVYRLCSDMANLAQEAFHVLLVSSKNKLIDRSMITLGISNASLIHPREVFRLAIQKNASGILVVHNHPSGDTSPSSEDIRITKQLIEAGKVLDINLLDHIIIAKGIGDDQEDVVLSLREEGICKF